MNMELAEQLTPMPGYCIIAIERKPETSGADGTGVIIPDIARDLRLQDRDTMGFGKVIRVKDGWKEPAEFQPGDRVIVTLRQDDLGEAVIVAKNTRVVAILTVP